MKKHYIILLTIFGLTFSYAQEIQFQREQFRDQLLKRYETQKIRTERINSDLNYPKTYSFNGAKAELQYFTEENIPIYYTTYNTGAAVTTRANKLYLGGGLGLNIQGQGMLVGVWDHGGARTTHVDFEGRVTQGDGGNVEDHSTHVTGTIVGNGPAFMYRGIAFEAEAIVYNWTDDLIEMQNELNAQDYFLLSNHSYGYSVFNSSGQMTLPLYYFGAYLQKSRDVDNLTYLYKDKCYLPVIAAGNDRSQQSQINNKGGYDLLTGASTSKNSIVVGSVSEVSNYTAPSNVILATYSNYGPTDDLRIKPDLVAKGQSVNSMLSEDDTDRGPLSGTSMATPGVTGTLLLLQQYYHELNNSFMKAATLKGLALHTTDEAGPAMGPDPRYGWGLLNAEKAANAITYAYVNNTIQETTLNDQEQITIDVVALGGGIPLEVSISWTDIPGEVSTGVDDDPTPALVNDLDIRVIKDDNTYYPWKLVPDNFLIYVAQQADNTVDPFEKVQINDASGVYQIVISHKGTLTNDAQDFSLIVTGAEEINLSTSNNQSIAGNIKIYPNPTSDFLYFISSESNISVDKVEIYDTIGKRVFASELNNNSIDISNLTPGVYMVKIYSEDGGYVTKKIIKK
ncbi:MAG: S8 family serine peptidase [Flavobacteriaceae bacterium]